MKNKKIKDNFENYIYGELVTHLETLCKGMSAIDEHLILSMFSRWLDIRINNLADEISEDK